MDTEPLEQSPPRVEYWRGHMNVERPAERVTVSRRAWFALGISLGVGLLVFAALWLVATRSHDPSVLSTGVSLVSVASLALAVFAASPLPLSLNFMRVQNLNRQPLPLLWPALMLLGFALPSLIVVAAGILAAVL